MSHKILIIDDDEFLLDIYSTKFKEDGFDVEVAKGGKEALLKVTEFKPDVVLVDIVMPDMDGFETIKLLKKKLGDSAKIVALSNLDQKESIDKALSFGADDYAIKAEFTPSQVLKKVKKICTKNS